MKRIVRDRWFWLLTKRKSLQFLFIVLLASSLAFYISGLLPKGGGVWDGHLKAGLLFLKGSIPKIPAYPMWGYSLLSGVFKENITLFQGALLLVVCLYWYKSLFGFATIVQHPRKLTKIIENPIVVAIMLVPFIFLSLSYFSNSMASILVFWGVWMLYLAVENKRGIGYYAASGLLIGLGFNFRSENLLLGILLFFALLAFGFLKRRVGHYLRMAAMFLITLFLAVLPWITYTSFTVKQPLLCSTNAGAVMYLGLGILPNNPWNILPGDGYVLRIASERNLGSPWSADANEYFRLHYLQSIKEHPMSFVKRVVVGCRHMLMQGLYFPDFRNLVSDNRDKILVDYLNERMQLAFGLKANRMQLEQYRSMGIDSKALSFRHYAIVVSEYGLRFMYLCIFIMLLGSCILLSLKTRFDSFAAFIFTAHFAFILFRAGFIQTLPRHTTLVLPILISTMIVLLRNPSQREAG
ncbi:MAG: glycosyltransferase family 39 protein [Candidatus Eisenbacteria bacterium]